MQIKKDGTVMSTKIINQKEKLDYIAEGKFPLQ